MIPRRLRAGMGREIGRLADLGIPAEALDLRDYFTSQELLAEKLAAAGMLWVLGGNTFLLRKAMHLSGLDQLILGKVGDEHRAIPDGDVILDATHHRK